MRVALIIKSNKPYAKQVKKFCNKKFNRKINFFDADRDNLFLTKLKKKKYDVILSYLSPKIIPKKILNKTKKYNINFHPALPRYPGFGGFNFAIFNKDKFYGCTAHLMNEKVDSGKIIGIKEFKLNKNETVKSLSLKTYKSMFHLFKKVINDLQNNKIKFKKISWSKTKYTKKKLDKLSTIKIKMSEKRINKIIRSTYFCGYSYPRIQINKHIFIYKKNVS